MRAEVQPRSASEPVPDAFRQAIPGFLRQRGPAPGGILEDRDVLEPPAVSPRMSAEPLADGPPSAAFNIDLGAPDSPPRSFWRRCQVANQQGWLGHTIRWMPLIGVLVGSAGLYFGVRNFRLIFAQRTFALLRQTGPALNAAHNHILEELAKIEMRLNITNVTGLEPPLPPEQFISQPGR